MMENGSANYINILSVHWGFSLGGVGKYATLIETVESYAPIKIKSICVIGQDWQTDAANLAQVDHDIIYIQSRLDTSWVSKISSFIKDHEPDLIMTHGFNGHFVALVTQLFRKKKIPVVSSYHGLYHASTFSRRLYGHFFNELTERFLRHRATAIVCVADHSRNYLIGKGIDPEKLTVIHNGIENSHPNTTRRSSLRSEWGIKEGELLFGTASRLDPVKGLKFLVEAMGLIDKNCSHARLVIIGTGTLDKQLKKQVKELGLESRVIFTGYREDIDQCLGAFDVFMLPSLAEYHSIAILEAMRAGKAVIATDVGGNTESVRDNKEALIVPSNNAPRLAEAMKILAKDNLLRIKLGENARTRFLDEFTVDIMVTKTAKWLLSCVDLVKNRQGWK
jgi:glycosyltransferase involved in cell wall biosynthesis